ncbi:hypothetical protein JCM30204_49050 [Dysgonomonas termitidis]
MALAASAQEVGDKEIGGHISSLSGDLKKFGIGAKFQYQVTEPIRLEVAGTYYFGKKEELVKSAYTLEVNGHYLFPVSEKVTLYPLAGIGVIGGGKPDLKAIVEGKAKGLNISGDYLDEWMDKYMDILEEDMEDMGMEDFWDEYGAKEKWLDGTKIGINLGGGIDYKLNETVTIGAQLKKMFFGDGYSPIAISAGITCKF